jgi:hypothetical protein|tara:strand:- start:613 stop:1134 length:522 start_codon:yes stop_codon:yes gene_type:complete
MSWEDILKSKTDLPMYEGKGPNVDRLRALSKSVGYWREWVEDKKGRKVRKKNILREHLLTEPLAKKALEVLDKVTFTHDQKGKEGNVTVVTEDEYIITARWSSYPAIHPVYGKYKQGGEGTIFGMGLTVIKTFSHQEPAVVDIVVEIPRAKEIDEFDDQEIDSYSWMVDWRNI